MANNEETTNRRIFDKIFNSFSQMASRAMSNDESTVVQNDRPEPQRENESTAQVQLVNTRGEPLRSDRETGQRLAEVRQNSLVNGPRSGESTVQLVNTRGEPIRSDDASSRTELIQQPPTMEEINENMGESLGSTPLAITIEDMAKNQIGQNTKLDEILKELEEEKKARKAASGGGGGGGFWAGLGKATLKLIAGYIAYEITANAGDISTGASRMIGGTDTNEAGETVSTPKSLAAQGGMLLAAGGLGYFTSRKIAKMFATGGKLSKQGRREMYKRIFKEYLKKSRISGGNISGLWNGFHAFMRASSPKLWKYGVRVLAYGGIALAGLTAPAWMTAALAIWGTAEIGGALYNEFRRYMNLPVDERSVFEKLGDFFRPEEFDLNRAEGEYENDETAGYSPEENQRFKEYLDSLPGERDQPGADLYRYMMGKRQTDKRKESMEDLGSRLYGGEKYTFTSDYGERDNPMNPGTKQFHGGVDVAGKKGSAIRAPYEGQFYDSNYLTDFGRYVTLSHGPDGRYKTMYGHLNDEETIELLKNIKVGDKIPKGTPIGVQGNTGEKSTGEHLHYQVFDSDLDQDGVMSPEEQQLFNTNVKEAFKKARKIDPAEFNSMMMEEEIKESLSRGRGSSTRRRPSEPEPETTSQTITPTEVMPQQSSVGPELRSAGGERQQQMMASAAPPVIINNTPITNSPVIAPPQTQQNQKMPHVISTIDDILPESVRINFNSDRWALA